MCVWSSRDVACPGQGEETRGNCVAFDSSFFPGSKPLSVQLLCEELKQSTLSKGGAVSGGKAPCMLQPSCAAVDEHLS